jgi:cytochrome c-type biogenesis protein
VGRSAGGAVYGLGWTPCLGPTLAGVIALASGTQVGPTTERGLLLIAAYRLGLGLPFILLALGARWAVDATVRPERASQAGEGDGWVP